VTQANPAKEKWLFAFNVVPGSKLDPAQLAAPLPGATNNPLVGGGGGGRNGPGGGGGGAQRGAPGPDSFFFGQQKGSVAGWLAFVCSISPAVEFTRLSMARATMVLLAPQWCRKSHRSFCAGARVGDGPVQPPRMALRHVVVKHFGRGREPQPSAC
jgi:hypothetical protein